MTLDSDTCVRSRTDADLLDCESLLKIVHLADGYPSSWPASATAWLTPRGLFAAWVALRETTIIGHVVLGRVDAHTDPHLARTSRHPAEELAEVKRLFVHPSARASGVATLLLDAAVRAAQALGLHPILEVTADKPAAIRFYERCGWQRIGTNVATWERSSGERPILHQYELRARA